MTPLIISTPGLCHSNQGNVFPNLARQQNPDPGTVAEVTSIATAELVAAGIEACRMPFLPTSEVPSMVIGSLSMWTFERAWYYWRAKGPGLPVEIAERLHGSHGTQVRVDGHCACPSPREWFKGFGVGHYHVDTQDGLNALAAAIRSVYCGGETE